VRLARHRALPVVFRMPPAMLRRTLCVLVVSSLGLALVACRGGDETSPAATPTAMSGTAVPTEQGIRTRPVVWTTLVDPKTGEPRDRVRAFPRDTDTIYAALEVISMPEGGVLTATWEINGRPVAGLYSTIKVDDAQSTGWAEFHLVWESQAMWPVGILSIMITSSTGEIIESSVEIAR